MWCCDVDGGPLFPSNRAWGVLNVGKGGKPRWCAHVRVILQHLLLHKCFCVSSLEALRVIGKPTASHSWVTPPLIEKQELYPISDRPLRSVVGLSDRQSHRLHTVVYNERYCATRAGYSVQQQTVVISRRRERHQAERILPKRVLSRHPLCRAQHASDVAINCA